MRNVMKPSGALNGFRRVWWLGVWWLGMLSACVALADIDKSQAADIAQRTYGGKLFGKIDMVRLSDERVVYEVRLDDKGHMIIVHVDLQGKIVNNK